MFNGTLLFKPGIPGRRREREEYRIKSLWLLIKNGLFVFFHQRSRLKTRRVSPSPVECWVVTFDGSLPLSETCSSGAMGRMVREGERAGCAQPPPSRTNNPAFVSRAWRFWRKITSFAEFF